VHLLVCFMKIRPNIHMCTLVTKKPAVIFHEENVSLTHFVFRIVQKNVLSPLLLFFSRSTLFGRCKKTENARN
jgi:hypothetical protein